VTFENNWRVFIYLFILDPICTDIDAGREKEGERVNEGAGEGEKRRERMQEKAKKQKRECARER